MLSTVQWYIQKQFPDVNQMSTDELHTQLLPNPVDVPNENIGEPAKNTIIVDCRQKDEFDVSHLPDSKHIHFQSGEAALQNFLTTEWTNQQTVSSENLNNVNNSTN